MIVMATILLRSTQLSGCKIILERYICNTYIAAATNSTIRTQMPPVTTPMTQTSLQMPASARPLVFSDVTGTCAVELVKFPVVVGIDVTFSTFEVGDVIMEENTDTEEVGPCVSEVELPVVDDDVIDELAVVCDVRKKCRESAVVVVD